MSGLRRGIVCTQLARRLSRVALAYRSSRGEQDLAQLEQLVQDAAAHVRQVGCGTVNHIVLSSMLKAIADEVPSVGRILADVGWQWHQPGYQPGRQQAPAP